MIEDQAQQMEMNEGQNPYQIQNQQQIYPPQMFPINPPNNYPNMSLNYSNPYY